MHDVGCENHGERSGHANPGHYRQMCLFHRKPPTRFTALQGMRESKPARRRRVHASAHISLVDSTEPYLLMSRRTLARLFFLSYEATWSKKTQTWEGFRPLKRGRSVKARVSGYKL